MFNPHIVKGGRPEGLDDFSKRCEAIANAIHDLMVFDDKEDPAGLREAILVAYLNYVLPPRLQVGR